MKNTWSKREYKEMVDYAIERIQKEMKEMYGYAPTKKEIVPLEFASDRIDGFWFISDMRFAVGTVEYALMRTGKVEMVDM